MYPGIFPANENQYLMKPFFTLLSIFSFLSCFSQITVGGSSTAVYIANNAPASVVDDALTITGSATIDGAKASVSVNFSSGDILSFSSSALPSGVTGSYSSSTGILTFTGNATAAQYQALLRTVAFNTTSSSTSQRTVLFNVGTAIAYSGNGHFYEFVSGSYSWTASKTNAAAKTLYGLHGYLATITSQAENDFIQQKLSADGWIGASDDYAQINAATGVTTYSNQTNAEGKWYWVTGPVGEIGKQFSTGNYSPVVVSGKYMNWNTLEPNNSGTENYGQIYSSGAAGKWNDLSNSNSLGYVVEYGGLSNDPTVSLTSSRNITMISTKLTTSASVVPYALKTDATYVDNALTLYSSGSITNFSVTISTNFKTGDVLSYTGALPSGVTASYNSATGVLSFTGTATSAQWQTLLRTVKFNSTSSVLANRDITFSAGNLVAFTNGHYYEYVSSAVSWTTAKANAAAKTYMGLQGYLATITSQNENDFIKVKLGADAWIGASDDYSQINLATGSTTYSSQTLSEGKWYWVTGPVGEIGTQFSSGNNSPSSANSMFMNWNSGEPNNAGTENYGEIYASGTNVGKWNDLGTSSSLGYIVEYGGLASDPVVYLSSSRTMAISLTPLPLTGMRFSAQKDEFKVQLSWSTETEINTARFEIERSGSGGDRFRKIGDLKAAGNSVDKRTYQWTDEHPQSGMNYYRLKETDIDGKFIYSDVKIILFPVTKTLLSPNPATSYINITLPAKPVAGASIIILNMNGQPVIKKALLETQQIVSIDISGLTPGAYIAQVPAGDGIEKLKFIKK